MRQIHSVAIALIHLLVIASPYVNCVQIDNELVSKQYRKYSKREEKLKGDKNTFDDLISIDIKLRAKMLVVSLCEVTCCTFFSCKFLM